MEKPLLERTVCSDTQFFILEISSGTATFVRKDIHKGKTMNNTYGDTKDKNSDVNTVVKPFHLKLHASITYRNMRVFTTTTVNLVVKGSIRNLIIWNTARLVMCKVKSVSDLSSCRLLNLHLFLHIWRDCVDEVCLFVTEDSYLVAISSNLLV